MTPWLWMRCALTLTLLALFSACYASHEVPTDGETDTGLRFDTGPRFDGGPRSDAPAFDVASFDVAFPDASFEDAPPDDADSPCRLVLVDEQVIAWPSADCGQTSYPEVVAVDGPLGPFQLLVTEQRSCRDRAALLLTRRITTDDNRIGIQEELALAPATGPAHMATNGEEFAVCSGEGLHVRYPGGAFGGTLRPPAMPLPGCPRSIRCEDLAVDGMGWGVIWERFDCDVVLSELSRIEPRGGLRGPSFEVIGDTFTSIIPAPYGFAATSQSRRGEHTFYEWPRSSNRPSTVPLDGIVASGASALSAWVPPPGAWALVAADEGASTLRLHVFDTGDGRYIERNYEGEITGYSATSIRVAPTDFGLAVAIGYSWAGGRVDTATRFVAIGPSGELLLDVRERDFGSATSAPIDVAVRGGQILVHRKGLVSDAGDSETVALLYACE